MSGAVKITLYVVCVVAVIVFGSITVSSYRQATKASERRSASLSGVTAEKTNATELTNTVASITNAAATNAAGTNVVEAKRDPDTGEAIEIASVSTRGYTRMISYGLVLLLFFLGLAVLIAYDISQFLARKAEQALFTDDGAPVDSEYEQAEDLCKDGKYLEALNAMREYLKKHPREQYVALRIAEIYEENLQNPLAAALEYEEVLKKKLPAERWGWAAIHLANLYSGKLNQPDKSIAMLRRIDSEYGQTTAAKKARERLTQVDPNFVPSNAPVVPVAVASPESATEAQPSNLPPGFRPKS